MSDQAIDAGFEPESTTTEAPDQGASVVEAPEPEAPPTPEPAEPSYPWSREHPEWSPEDAWKAYSEARTKISRGEHQPQPEPEPEERNPYEDLPAGDDPGVVEDLSLIFAGQKTFRDGTYGPQAVMNWVAGSDLSQQTKGAFLQAWQSQDAWSASQWFTQHTLASERDAMRNELRQEYAPAVESTMASMNSTAITLASQEIPDFDKWAPRIAEYVTDENPHALAGVQGSQAIADRLVDIVGVLHMRDQRAQRRAANQNGAATPPPASAATQTRSKQAPASERDAYRESVRESLRKTPIS